LLGVLVGAIAALGILAVWLPQIGVSPAIRLILTAAALIVVIGGYLYPVFRYMGRSAQTPEFRRQTLTRMGLGACLSGIALLGTWGSIQWATNWVDLFPGRPADAKQWTQFWSAMGAVVSTAIAPFVCEWLGRRITYAVLCVAAFAATVFFYQGGARYDSYFLFRVFLGGAFSATFYGFLPLYLPELFATRVRATGQGFSYNFGRIIAATGALTGWVQSVELASWMDKGIPAACTLLSLVYFVGVAIIWLAPETKGKPLPE
jgi:MFS transporter, SHS family, sialic acid transporter